MFLLALANILFMPPGQAWGNHFLETFTHITSLHDITLHYIPQTHDFAEIYCVFRTLMALLEHNRCGNTRWLTFSIFVKLMLNSRTHHHMSNFPLVFTTINRKCKFELNFALFGHLRRDKRFREM